MQTTEVTQEDIDYLVTSRKGGKNKVKKPRRTVRRVGINKPQLVRKLNAWGRKNKDVIKHVTADDAASVATREIGHVVTHSQIKRVRNYLGIHLYATKNHKRSRTVRRAEPVKQVKQPGKAEKRTATYIKVAKFPEEDSEDRTRSLVTRIRRVEYLLSLLYSRLGEPLPLH